MKVLLMLHLSTQEYKWVPVNCQGKLAKSWKGDWGGGGGEGLVVVLDK